jgi:hypothetical protein
MMDEKNDENKLSDLLTFYGSYIAMVSIFLGFTLATIALVSFQTLHTGSQGTVLWLLLSTFSLFELSLVRTHSNVIKEGGKKGQTLPCPWLNDEIFALAILSMSLSLAVMAYIGGLTLNQAIFWVVIYALLAVYAYIIIKIEKRKAKKQKTGASF